MSISRSISSRKTVNLHIINICCPKKWGGTKYITSPHFKKWGDLSPCPPYDRHPCYSRRCLHISYTERVTNDEVLRRVGQDRALLGQVKSRKLKYFGHVTRHNSLEKDTMLGTMPDTRRQGGQWRQWLDNVTQWAEMGLVDTVRLAEDRNWYRRFVFGDAYNSFTRHGKLRCLDIYFRTITGPVSPVSSSLLSSITPSFFHSKLKTFLFLKSYSP